MTRIISTGSLPMDCRSEDTYGWNTGPSELTQEEREQRERCEHERKARQRRTRPIRKGHVLVE